MGADVVQRRAHHDWVGFAHVVRFHAGHGGDHGGDGAGCWDDSVRAGAGQVGVRRDEAGAASDEVRGGGEGFEGVGAGLAEHDEVGVRVGENPADFVQGRGQAGLADDVRGGLAGLLREKLRGRRRRGPDPFRFDVQAHALQFRGEVARGLHRVVGQHHELDFLIAQGGDELLRAGNDGALFVQHAVHVGQV